MVAPAARVVRLENGPRSAIRCSSAFRANLVQLREGASAISSVACAPTEPAQRQFRLERQGESGTRRDRPGARPRAQGVSSQDVALTLQGWLAGATVYQFREDDQLIDVVWRAGGAGAATPPIPRTLARLPDLDVVASSNRHVPWRSWHGWCRYSRKA